MSSLMFWPYFHFRREGLGPPVLARGRVLALGAAKCLTNTWEGYRSRHIAAASFHDINTFTMAKFKLPT